jgi:hypothetical protein
MSTKMYNLYRTSMNLAQLDTWLQALKEKHFESLIYQIAPFVRIAKGDLWEKLMEDTKAGYRSPFNIDGSVVLYIDGRSLYVQFFGVKYELYEKDVQEGLLSDFHYQNQSDMPDDISAQEWKKREKVVSRLLNKDDSGIASRCGFKRVLTDQQDCMKVSMYVEEYLRSKEG